MTQALNAPTPFAIDTQRPFFLMRRKNEARVLVCTGDIAKFRELDEIPLVEGASAEGGVGAEAFDTVNLVPFAQARERGFPVHDDGEPIVSLQIKHWAYHALEDVIDAIPNIALTVGDLEFSTTPEEYEAIIRRIVQEEIGGGQGANFVIARRGTVDLPGITGEGVLSIFRSLLLNEFGTYWTFAFFDGEHYHIGVSPERHISAQRGEVMMNPISGTFRKNPQASAQQNQDAFLDFLRDEKEIFELFMVSDEELKIMCEICDHGGAVIGPLLKEMSRLIHTEYLLMGKSGRSLTELLRRSMFAPTVTGSPVLSAFRVIKRYETESRGYYGGTIGLIGRDAEGQPTLDAPITIRTIQIDREGKAVVRVGTTLVRGSDPASEVKETEVKIAGLINAIRAAGQQRAPQVRLLEGVDQETVQILLQGRNQYLSRFWFEPQSANFCEVPELRGKTVTIVDAEDDFTMMIKRLIAQMGAQVRVVSFEHYREDDADILLCGPGPGDPTAVDDPKMRRMTEIIRSRLDSKRPMFAVCLSHQILCHQLGLPVVSKEVPFQGAQEQIDLFGTPERVGFYNTFTGIADRAIPGVEFSYDPATREIHAIRSEHFYGVQFHAESILTTRGYDITRQILMRLLRHQGDTERQLH